MSMQISPMLMYESLGHVRNAAALILANG